MTPDLPFVDEHRACLPHPRERVWSALDRYAARSLRLPPRLALVLGTDPAEGFARTTVRAPERLDLEGRHRFSTYLLRFDLDENGDGTVLRASTYAVFPGLRGRVYRALVIGSGGHAVAVRRMLRAVERGIG
ncbi:MAG TPA: hypothetical protein VHR35_16490 [Nocardioides sp.]|jgi:hypothetical protein|nr:hypothetical protein [Nocardioides sp.]